MQFSADPIRDPQGYQDLLLELLGEDDPAAVQAATPATLRQMVDESGPYLRERPEPTEWSVVECLGHLVDAEIVGSCRYRWVLAQDEPTLMGYDQDLWVERLRHGEGEADALLELFAALRLANVTLWQRTRKELRSRIGMHVERGPESYDLMFRMLAGHDRFHLAQARRALDAVRGT